MLYFILISLEFKFILLVLTYLPTNIFCLKFGPLKNLDKKKYSFIWKIIESGLCVSKLNIGIWGTSKHSVEKILPNVKKIKNLSFLDFYLDQK